jgi:hypothetical protein
MTVADSHHHLVPCQAPLKSKRRLARNEVMMRVSNGHRVDILVVDTLHLRLPSKFIIVLNKCYYVPSLSMNIISGSRMSRDGYFFKSVTNSCSIYKDDIFYVHAPDNDGLYILDLDCNGTHINSVDNKRCKLSDDNAMYM